MNRSSLAWFAAGAATSSLVAIATFTFQGPDSDDEDRWFLRVAEDGQSLRDGSEASAWKGAEIARDCGAKSFEAFPGAGSDDVDSTRIPLEIQNNAALGCIVQRSREADLWIGVQMENPN